MAKIAIVIYSMYHHVAKLAEAVKAGIEASGVASATIYRVEETLPKSVLEKMHAAPELSKYAVATNEMFKENDGFLFGVPTRYGMMPSQLKAFFDATGALWMAGALVGKPAGFFFCTAAQNGGQETTVLTTLPFLAHHGMIFVPLGFTHPSLKQMTEIQGGSAWGAGTIAGTDGSRQPSTNEIEVAQHQGKSFASVVAKLKFK